MKPGWLRATRHLWIPLGAVGLLTLVLLLVLGDAVRGVIAGPLAYIYWFAGLVTGLVPQWVLWVVLLVVLLVVAVRSLPGRERAVRRGPGAAVVYPGRVEELIGWIERAGQGVYSRQRLARRLGVLAVDAWAYRERVPATPSLDSPSSERGGVQRRLEGLGAPPDVLAYLQAGFGPPSPRTTRSAAWIARLLRPEGTSSPLDLDLERAIRFLEGQLTHERYEEEERDGQ